MYLNEFEKPTPRENQFNMPSIRHRLESEEGESEDSVLLTRHSTCNETSQPDNFNFNSSTSKKKQTNNSFSLGKRISKLFWKPKYKSSFGSEYSSSEVGSPILSPSSASPLINSVDENDFRSRSSSESTSNNSNSGHASGSYLNTKESQQFCTFDYDDCQQFATNMYYNIGEGSNFAGISDGLRPRNNSIPTACKDTFNPGCKSTTSGDYINESTLQSYYNTNFLTFPNPRRHSISSSSLKTFSKMGEKTQDGYLLPINKKQNSTVQEHFQKETKACGVGVILHSDQNKSLNEKHSSNESSTTVVGLLSEENPDRTVPLHLSSNQELPSSWNCEPYCSLCAASKINSNKSPLSHKSSVMDVAFVSCHECLISQQTENKLEKFFGEIVGSDGKKLDVRLKSYDLKELDQQKVATEVHRSKVQIVIISANFLDRLKQEVVGRKDASSLNRILRPNRIIAVLTSLAKDTLQGYKNVLSRLPEWHTVELHETSRLDTEFCKRFTDQVIKIYNVEVSYISRFTVFPKKVTQDQPKLVILFKKPTEYGDTIRVELRRGRITKHIEGVETINPFTAVVRIPDSLCAQRTALIEISVVLNNTRLGAKLIKCEGQSKHEEDVLDRMIQALPGFQKILDDHISQVLSKDIRMNEDFSLDPALEVMNDALICKADIFPTMTHFASYYGLEQTVYALLEEGDGLEHCGILNDAGDNPASLATSRGFQTTIGQMIQDYQEVTLSWRAFQYVKKLYESRQGEEANYKYSEKSCKDVEISTNVNARNSKEVLNDHIDISFFNSTSTRTEKIQFPSDSGNKVSTEDEDVYSKRISERMKSFEHKSETTISKEIMDETLKNIHPLESYDIPPPIFAFPSSITTNNEIVYYDTPRPSQEDYCIPPTDPRPILPEKRIVNNQMTPVLTKKTDTISDPDGYIYVGPTNSEGKRLSSSDPGLNVFPEEQKIVPDEQVIPSSTSQTCLNDPLPLGGSDSLPQVSTSQQVVLDPTEEELVELMNGFKNNVYSMRELELLFENWKSRTDVQRDFMERQKQLKSTRDHYKKIQDHIRRNNKNSGLDRFLKLIPGSRRKHSANLTMTQGYVSREETNKNGNVSVDQPNTQGTNGEEDSEKGPIDGPTFWKNPLDRRFVTSYVPPNSEPILQMKPQDNATFFNTPPPRPFKKPSLISSPEVTTASPPLSPFLNKKQPPLPPPEPNQSDLHSHKQKKSKRRAVQPQAPPTPPRNIGGIYH